MIVPKDVGITSFHGDAALKATLLERLRRYAAEGEAKLKMTMLQEEWNGRARHGPVLNPYPKTVRPEDIAGIRITGEVSTLYALGAVGRSNLFLHDYPSGRRIYIVQPSNFYSAVVVPADEVFRERLGVPPTLASVLSGISRGLPAERETSWLKQFWEAVPVGASLWAAPMRLILWALTDPSYGILGLSGAAERTAARNAGRENEAQTDNHADSQAGSGLKAVQDFLAMYQHWLASDKTQPQEHEWHRFFAQSAVNAGWHRDDNDNSVHDLPLSERCCLLAADGAARSAVVEEAVMSPLPEGTASSQLTGQHLDAPGDAIYQAGMYASDRGIAPSDWYEACASVLLSILADRPVPERPA